MVLVLKLECVPVKSIKPLLVVGSMEDNVCMCVFSKKENLVCKLPRQDNITDKEIIPLKPCSAFVGLVRLQIGVIELPDNSV